MKRLFLFSTLCLIGCNSFSIKEPPYFEKHRTVYGTMSMQWRDKAEQASFILQYDPTDIQLEIYGPLGLGKSVLIISKNKTTLMTKGKEFIAPSPEILLKQYLGYSWPVKEVIYWIRGRPDPFYPYYAKKNKNHQILELKQNGWTIRYKDYPALDIMQARKIIFEHPEIKITLILKEWKT